MKRFRLSLFFALVASAGADEISHVKHHHHKHHHHHSTETTAKTSQPATSPTVPAGVSTYVDAQRAHDAAETAKDAATIAKQVAEHTLAAAVNAKSALKNAKDALHDARVDSKGLSPEQEENLKMAEAKLSSATAAFPHSTNPLAAEEHQELQNRADKLVAELAENRTRGEAEVKQMQEELKALRAEIKGVDKGEKSVQEMDAELKELREMLKQLEEAEKNTPPSDIAAHEDLKIEIQHLRDNIKRLEQYGAVTAKFDRVQKKDPATGVLRYRMEMHQPRPKVQLTPLVDLEVSETASEKASEKTVKHKRARTEAVRDTTEDETGGDDDEASSGDGGRIDVDTAMPYGELEPFGREDTAQELTEASIRESDGMVDQLERAEVAEEKRAVFRALTRLRGAAITSFDGVARSQSGNIDEYNKVHKWRNTHPLAHLADEEADVSKWAFPDNADF